MSSFNMIVLEVAVVILIISLVLIGWGIYNMEHGSQVQYPPVEGTCPDFWNTTIDENNITYCNNTLKVGSNKTSSMCKNFASNLVNTDCKKWSLANNCGITWDGITDNNDLQAQCSGQDPPSANNNSANNNSCPSTCDTNSSINVNSTVNGYSSSNTVNSNLANNAASI